MWCKYPATSQLKCCTLSRRLRSSVTNAQRTDEASTSLSARSTTAHLSMTSLHSIPAMTSSSADITSTSHWSLGYRSHPCILSLTTRYFVQCQGICHRCYWPHNDSDAMRCSYLCRCWHKLLLCFRVCYIFHSLSEILSYRRFWSFWCLFWLFFGCQLSCE